MVGIQARGGGLNMLPAFRPSLRKHVDIWSEDPIQGHRSSHSEWAIKWKGGISIFVSSRGSVFLLNLI